MQRSESCTNSFPRPREAAIDGDHNSKNKLAAASMAINVVRLLVEGARFVFDLLSN
jgi:hypothetical protein